MVSQLKEACYADKLEYEAVETRHDGQDSPSHYDANGSEKEDEQLLSTLVPPAKKLKLSQTSDDLLDSLEGTKKRK